MLSETIRPSYPSSVRKMSTLIFFDSVAGVLSPVTFGNAIWPVMIIFAPFWIAYLNGIRSQASSSAAASSASASASAASASASASAASATAADEVAFTMTIDASDADKGVLYEANSTAKKGATVYDALIDTGLDLTITSSSGSTYVDGIEGVVASEVGPNAGWMFTVNGEMPSVGADALEIADGDQIEWTFTSDFTKAQ